MKWNKIKTFIVNILLALAVGGLSAFFTRSSMKTFDALSKPALTPPSYVFPIVWTILFILMGVGAAIVILKSGGDRRSHALKIYWTQLVVNFLWSILFFNLHLYLVSFLWLILLWILIFMMIKAFYNVNHTAGLLQIPYLLWVTFAGYLNLMIWMMN